ncbi:MAG: hypothetical protein LBR28_07855 [Bacteroidales bacterium]|jgi:RHS repeat-associated protein|nr:hypothetical protein [Bacteroidales bacterium]
MESNYKKLESNSVQNSLNLNDPEPAFYYLTDHLGSSSYITDGQGNVTQTISYLPFGEEQVDISYNNPAFETTYKFNGKEKDEETGFNYYGARYYYDYLSIWLSVDPLMHKYPHLSPYVYCANNPVNAIDPNGKEIKIPPANKKQWKRAKNEIMQMRDRSKANSPEAATLQKVLKTMSRCEKSDKTYVVNYIENGTQNHTSMQEDAITFTYCSTSGMIHEIGGHGSQIENGELDFDIETKTAIGYDITDEIDAYTLQGQVDPASLPDELLIDGKVNITEETVRSIKDNDGNRPYEKLEYSKTNATNNNRNNKKRENNYENK